MIYFIHILIIVMKSDCEEIDLLNCGPHTCGMTSAVCQQGISNIIKDLLIGLGKLFLNVITFGLSKPLIFPTLTL